MAKYCKKGHFLEDPVHKRLTSVGAVECKTCYNERMRGYMTKRRAEYRLFTRRECRKLNPGEIYGILAEAELRGKMGYSLSE